MVTLSAHFDGKAVVLDDPPTALRPGTRLKIIVEHGDQIAAVTPAPRVFQPLNIHIDPELSNAIALDAEFNIGER